MVGTTYGNDSCSGSVSRVIHADTIHADTNMYSFGIDPPNGDELGVLRDRAIGLTTLNFELCELAYSYSGGCWPLEARTRETGLLPATWSLTFGILATAVSIRDNIPYKY